MKKLSSEIVFIKKYLTVYSLDAKHKIVSVDSFPCLKWRCCSCGKGLVHSCEGLRVIMDEENNHNICCGLCSSFKRINDEYGICRNPNRTK